MKKCMFNFKIFCLFYFHFIDDCNKNHFQMIAYQIVIRNQMKIAKRRKNTKIIKGEDHQGAKIK